ncbi:MAG: RNA polymerase sigma factor [Planctomycetota bacterium]|nr:MAG: RNA polymerase sigma factor [Planctomycetota bacterium]
MKAQEVERDMELPVIEAIQQGDPYAMEELIRRQDRWVRGVIFGVLGRMDEVDDVSQRVWMQVWRQAKRLEDSANWRSWLYRIARNAATDTGRDKQRRKRLLANLFTGKPIKQHNDASPQNRLIANEQYQNMLDAIVSLPRLYREPFVLKHLQDFSYRQIAETLELPVDTVETRLVRARRLLRQKLAGKV